MNVREGSGGSLGLGCRLHLIAILIKFAAFECAFLQSTHSTGGSVGIRPPHAACSGPKPANRDRCRRRRDREPAPCPALGAALQIYRGDPESYFSFITPEACMYLDMYREQWRRDVGAYPKPGDPLLRTTVQIAVKRLNAKGVKARVTSLASGVGLRPKLPAGRRRHSVPIDHGFRKYFNTMMRRAKVDYLDKEDMMGHSTGLEKHYERYCEEDFERFPGVPEGDTVPYDI